MNHGGTYTRYRRTTTLTAVDTPDYACGSWVEFTNPENLKKKTWMWNNELRSYYITDHEWLDKELWKVRNPWTESKITATLYANLKKTSL